MRRFQLILAYYTLFASGGLFFWAIFLSPKPLGFLIAAIIIPVAVYFWAILLGRSKIKAVEYPKEAKSESELAKVALIVLSTLFISVISMLFYSYVNAHWFTPEDQMSASVASKLSLIEQDVERLNTNGDDSTGKILDEIKSLKNDVTIQDASNSTKPTGTSQLLGVSNSNLGSITVKSSDYQHVNAYKDADSSSDVVGQIDFGKNYTYLSKETGWYQVIFLSGTNTVEGYVSSDFVKEINY